MTPGLATPLAHQSGEGRRLLPIEVALETVTDRLVQENAGPAWSEHHGHLAGRRRHRVQVHQGLAQGLVDIALPGRLGDVLGIAETSADAVPATLLALTLADDHLHVETDQGTDVVYPVSVDAKDLHRLQLAEERGGDLADPGILGSGIAVDVLQQLHLGLEGTFADRVVLGIEVPVGAAWGIREDTLVARLDGLYRIRGALQRRFAELGRMPVAALLAGHGSEPEALRRVEVGVLQPTVVEAEALRLPVLEEELAVVGAIERIADEALDPDRIEPGAGEEEIV